MSLAVLWIPLWFVLLPVAFLLSVMGWLWRHYRCWTTAKKMRGIPSPNYSGFSEKPGKTHTRTTYHQGVEE